MRPEDNELLKRIAKEHGCSLVVVIGAALRSLEQLPVEKRLPYLSEAA
jgi:hypothetical protein